MQARPPSFDARGDAPDDSRADSGRRAQTTLDFAVGMSLFLISVAVVISFTPSLIEPFADSGTQDTVIANRAASQLVEGTLVNPDQPYVLNKACTIAFFAPENADGDPDNDQDLNDANDDQLERDRYDISDDSLWTDSCNFFVEVSNSSDYLHARLGIAGIADDGGIERSLSPGLQIEIRGDTDDPDSTPHLLCIDSNGDSSGDPWDDSDPDIEDPIVEAPDNDPWDTGDPCDASSGDYDIPFQVGENPPDETDSVVVARRVVTIDGIRATVYVRVW